MAYNLTTPPRHSSRRELYERDIERARQAISVLNKFGEDLHENDTVVFYERTFHGRTYTYAAIKADDHWWVTGQDVVPFSWDDLVETHLSKATNVWVASTWVRI